MTLFLFSIRFLFKTGKYKRTGSCKKNGFMKGPEGYNSTAEIKIFSTPST